MQHPTTNRRKTIGLTAALLFVVFILNAQTVWNKTYTGGRPIMLFGSVVFDDTCYKVSGLTIGHTNNASKGLISNLDLTGDISEFKILGDSNISQYTLFRNTLIKTSDKRFAFTGYSNDSLAYLFFGIVNPQLDSVTMFRYYTPNTMAFQGNSLVEKDGYYYMTGVRTDSLQNDPNVFLMKIDAAGNRVYEKKFGVSTRFEEAQSIIALPNDHLLIGAVRLDAVSAIQTAQTWLIEVDTTGTLIRQWLDPNDSTYDAYGLKQTADGGFIYGTKKKVEDLFFGDVFTSGMIVKLNANFQKQWTFSEGPSSSFGNINDVEIALDGSYIACGVRALYGSDTNIVSGWVVKLDSYGQVIWDKVYRGIPATRTYNYLIDVDILPDGSIIAVGECQGNGNGPVQVGWFLKLDSNGCEIENCLVGIEEDDRLQTIDDRKIQIQPNPANGVVQLTLENEMIGGAISLYNLTGALVLQQNATGVTNQLNISALSKGLYVVTVQKQGQLARARLVVE